MLKLVEEKRSLVVAIKDETKELDRTFVERRDSLQTEIIERRMEGRSRKMLDRMVDDRYRELKEKAQQ